MREADGRLHDQHRQDVRQHVLHGDAKLPLPQARAASTNSRAHIALAEARVMRAKVGML